jgi:hypothetical protein
MKNGGIGIGSASLILVFAVLCLTVFSLITFVVARSNKALSDAEAKLVTGYYEADAIAENIVADIIQADIAPDNIRGIEITYGLDFESGAETAYFICPVSEQKELYVNLVIYEDSYNILSWRMFDIGKWVIDDSLNVWQGTDESGSKSPLDTWSGLDYII